MRMRILAAAIAVAALSTGATAYLKLGVDVGTRVVALTWSRVPVRYLVKNRGANDVSPTELQRAVSRAFSTWTTTPDVNISAEFAGFTDIEPFVSDNVTVIGFQSRPEMSRTLGATTFTVDDTTGEVLESDIFLNASFPWSISEAGQAGRFDVESIALHEIGHLFGLGHSALGETELTDGGRRILAKDAVMFPIAFPAGNTRDHALRPDDVAGLTDLYGTSTAARRVGSISGRVTLHGAGVFGAHVTATSLKTGETVGAFTLTANGDFVISALASGLYVVRAEPLDDADIESFFEDGAVNISFKPAYASKLAAVPIGGSGSELEIKVIGK